MEVVINDLEDLKKYMRVNNNKKTITFNFDNVVFDCALPSKNFFNYFVSDNIQEYIVDIKANSITFNYTSECDNIYANELVVKDMLTCKMLNVIGDTTGSTIVTDIFIGMDVDVKTFIVKKIVCKKIKAVCLAINREKYSYIKADALNNIGGEYGRN